MKKESFVYMLMVVLFSQNSRAQNFVYPASKTVDSSDVFFGKTYPDPYRWLEHLDKEETKAWFKEQNNYSNEIIDKMPLLSTIIEEQKAADKVRKIKYNTIVKKDVGFFYEKRTPEEQKFKIYFKAHGSNAEVLLFNPETFQNNKFEMFGWGVSENGKKIFLNLSEPGKEIGNVYLLNVATKKIESDSLINSRGEYWVPASDKQFFYNLSASNDVHSMDATLNTKEMLYNNGKSVEILSNKNNPELTIKPEEYPFLVYFENGNYMFGGKGTVDNNQQLYYAPKKELLQGKINWKVLCTKEDKITQGLCVGNDIYVLCTKNNSNFDVVKYSISPEGIGKPTVIYSPKNEVIQSISRTKSYILLGGIKDGIVSVNTKIDLANGKISPVNVPLKGINYLSEWDEKTDDCIVANTSWSVPFNRYAFNLANNSFGKSVFYTEVGFTGMENLASEEIEVVSHDGVKVPLSIVYDKNLFKKDGSNICYMDGYGSYGSSSQPYFSFANASLLKRGVVLAFAHIRGGGEKGEDWHMAGFKTTKPNTWKDFIACGDYLVKNKYTSSERRAGTGTSAGGILIGRAITERPDLFKVALPRVGCLNALRMEFSPNGPVNAPEFGTIKIEEEAKALAEMDAYLHLQKGTKYPAMLVSTGFNDPRVVSWQPGKFAAAAQNSTASGLPVLLKVNYAGGHFGGANVDEQLKDSGIEKAFILWQCGYKGQ